MIEKENGKKSEEGYVEIDPVYYYSREHRLSKASPAVRAMNDGKYIRPSARTLFATRGNAIVFATVVIFTVFGLSSRFMGLGRERGTVLGGNNLALTIVREEGVLFLGMTKNVPKNGEFYIGAVDIAVSPVIPKSREGETPQIYAHRVFFNPVESETYLVSLPFDENDFFVILVAENEQKPLRLSATEPKETRGVLGLFQRRNR